MDRTTRARLESDIFEHPESLLDEKAYFRLRKTNTAENVIYFPVCIKGARVSFGKVHFLIVPLNSVNEILGSRWVERKQLILVHEYQFTYLNKSFFTDISRCPAPHLDTRDFETQKERHHFYDKFFTDHPDIARLQRGFFQIGKSSSKDVLYFPIQIENGRKSFGQPQFLIVPYGSTIGTLKILSGRVETGCIWVSKSSLTMEYHIKFDTLQPSFEPFCSVNLLFDVGENND